MERGGVEFNVKVSNCWKSRHPRKTASNLLCSGGGIAAVIYNNESVHSHLPCSQPGQSLFTGGLNGVATKIPSGFHPSLHITDWC
jgi:hypothetical protein